MRVPSPRPALPIRLLATLILVACVTACMATPGLSRTSAASAGDRTRGKPIDVTQNIHYGKSPSGRALVYDLYLPRKFNPAKDAPLPVLVWFHGGAWNRGSEDTANLSAVSLAAEGVAVASVSYSLSQDAQFPVQLGEIRQALVHLQDNSRTYGLDMQNMGVWGDSAGGQLALMLGLASELKAGPADWPRPRFVVNLFGVTDFASMDEDCAAQSGCSDILGQGQRTMADYIGCKPAEARCQATARRASPISWIDANDPPVLTEHGSKDTVVPPGQARRLHEALQKAGVKSQLVIVPGKEHGKLGQQAADQAKKWVQQQLGLRK